jgi:prepilin-type N-terminal cleavage/methylation domain-containing protein
LLAFTLIELLTVIAIIGILAALLAPVLKNFSKSDVAVAATRQMLDDFARARQLAVSERTTVYMVFIPTNFWQDPLKTAIGANGWTSLQVGPMPYITTSTIVTQMYGAQWNGYMMISLRDVGDQPGRTFPRDLVRVKTLPDGAFIAPFKFTAPLYGSPGTPGDVPYPTNRPDLLIYGFLKTNTIPFPSADIETNSLFMSHYDLGTANFVTVPYIAFNYLGQLTSGDGSVLPYDENIPLDYGSIAEFRNQTNKMFAQGLPSAIESPPGNSTNVSYNIIHIDRLTGRARLERQDVL